MLLVHVGPDDAPHVLAAGRRPTIFLPFLSTHKNCNRNSRLTLGWGAGRKRRFFRKKSAKPFGLKSPVQRSIVRRCQAVTEPAFCTPPYAIASLVPVVSFVSLLDTRSTSTNRTRPLANMFPLTKRAYCSSTAPPTPDLLLRGYIVIMTKHG